MHERHNLQSVIQNPFTRIWESIAYRIHKAITFHKMFIVGSCFIMFSFLHVADFMEKQRSVFDKVKIWLNALPWMVKVCIDVLIVKLSTGDHMSCSEALLQIYQISQFITKCNHFLLTNCLFAPAFQPKKVVLTI